MAAKQSGYAAAGWKVKTFQNMACPYCQHQDQQVKAGLSGTQQRYKCNACGRRYRAEAAGRGVLPPRRQQALEQHAQGASVRDISRELGVSGQSVRNWLRANSLTPGHTASETPPAVSDAPLLKRRPTINDVARRAGVSRSTVSNLLNSKGRMSADTRQRVQEAMDALHFSPSALIRALHSQRTRIFGVLLFGLTTLGQDGTAGPSTLTLAGIAAAADAAGYNMLLYTGWERGAGRQAALEFLSGHIDGLIWVAPALKEPALERLAEAGLPVVSLLSRHVPDGVGFVNADNVAGMRELVVYLGSLGHRRIAYAGADRDSNFLDRRAGYREGLAALGLDYDPRLDIRKEFQEDAFLHIVWGWQSLPDPPTALVAPSDSSAQQIGAILMKAGWRVPEDICVTGFDDIPNAQTILGGLTTLHQPFREMGRRAGEALLALIGGASAETCRITVPVEMVVRASTAQRRDS